jgi:hypothetical protein
MAALDRYLTGLGDRIGGKWVDLTGQSRVVLTQGLYVLAAITAMQHVTISHNPIVLTFVGAAILCWMGHGQTRGGLVEQIQAEAAGLPKNAYAAMNFTALGIGLMQLAVAAGYLLEFLVGSPALPQEFVLSALLGCALTSLQASNYIRRTNPMTPSGGGRWRV